MFTEKVNHATNPVPTRKRLQKDIARILSGIKIFVQLIGLITETFSVLTA
jgi:hypothetical protein